MNLMPPFHSERLLVIEPDIAIQHMLRLYFGGAGCKVKVVDTPEQGMLLLADFEPDVVCFYNQGERFAIDAANKPVFDACMTQNRGVLILNSEFRRGLRDNPFWESLTWVQAVTRPFDIEDLHLRMLAVLKATGRLKSEEQD